MSYKRLLQSGEPIQSFHVVVFIRSCYVKDIQPVVLLLQLYFLDKFYWNEFQIFINQ